MCILLGAGASVPEPSNIPTVAGLLPELWKRARKLGREDIDQLMEWCVHHSVNSIEDVLTAAYVANFAAKSSPVTGLLNYFLFKREIESDEFARFRPGRRVVPPVNTASVAMVQDTLQVLFGLLTSRMISAAPNPAHQAVATFVRQHKKSTIITTNYDACVDEALLDAGVRVDAQLDESHKDEGALDLIKIHGSINWTYCDSCHDAHAFDLRTVKSAYSTDSLSFPVIGICRKCEGQRRPLLIPPMGLKFVIFPNLIRLWNTAREAIEKSRLLIVIGYSFSEADAYVNKVIERSVTVNPNQRMIVCDPNARLASALAERFAARIDGFDKARILRAVGSAEKLVPEVLRELANQAAAEPAPQITHPIAHGTTA